MIQKFSVNRPITVLMFYLALVIFGIISFEKLEIDLFPKVEFPEVSVITIYNGASPGEIETLISKPLEEVLGSISGVKSIKSESIEGASLIKVGFNWGTDIDLVSLKIREKVDIIKGSLPEDSHRSVVTRFNPNETPILGISVLNLNKKINFDFRNFIAKKIKPILEKIDGVASVKIIGGRKKEIQINVSRSMLFSYKINIFEIIEKLNLANYNTPAGNVSKGDKDYLVRCIGEFKKIDDIRNLIIKQGTDGQFVYLKDIAEVKDAYRDKTGAFYFNGKESVGLSIIKESDKNSVKVCRDIKNKILKINILFKKNIKLNVTYDTSEYIKKSISGVTKSAMYGGVIAFLIIFMFLNNFKNSIIVGIVLPFSIIITFLIMYLKGITINIISLAGLSIGIGMLVDNSIVVIESVDSKIKKGFSIKKSSILGVGEVLTPLLASTLTSIVVFFPIIFIKGISGAIFSDLAIIVSSSLVVSYLISISLVPSLYAIISGKLFFNRKFKTITMAGDIILKIEKYYYRFLKKNITCFKTGLFLLISSVVIGLILFLFITKEMIPESKNGIVIININAPQGTPIADTINIVKRIDKVLLEKNIFKIRTIKVGYNPEEISEYFGREKSKSSAELTLMLKDNYIEKEDQIINELKKEIQFGNIKIVIKKGGQELSTITKLLTSKQLINIMTPDYKISRNILERINSKMKSSGMILFLNPIVNKEKPEVKIKFDKDKLKSFGFTIKEAALQIRALSNGEKGGRFYNNNEFKDIIVRLKKDDRNKISDIFEFPILINKKIVKVKSFAIPEIKIGYTKILRKNQKLSYPVECRIIKGDFNKFKKILNEMKFDSNINIEIPEEEEMKSSIDSLFYSIILSILLIYMILASQFESFKKPLFIMLSVPLTILGVSFSLLITDTSINIISGLGMVMLSGIVVNNAIVLIEYIKNEIDSNSDLKNAIISGAAKRLKPIMMTSLTTIFALIPMAINIDSGNQASLAITVIGGLSLSTIFILILIPIFYYKIESNKSAG